MTPKNVTRKQSLIFQETGHVMRVHLHVTAVFRDAFHQLKSATNMKIAQMEVMSHPGCVVCKCNTLNGAYKHSNLAPFGMQLEYSYFYRPHLQRLVYISLLR